MSNDDRAVDRRTVLGGIGVGFVGLAGCIGGSDEDDEDGQNGGDSENGGDDENSGGNGVEGGSVSVTGVWSGGEEESFRQVTDHVQEDTGVEIEYHPRTTDALLTGTLMDYESSVAPADIVVMPSPARIRSDAGNGHLEAVGDVWSPDEYAPDPARVGIDGEVYAAPFKMDLKPGFWYRQSFFDEHGLSEPESYDEFMSLLEEINSIEGVDAPLASGNGDGWPLSDVTEAFVLRQENGAQLQRDLISGDAEFTDDRVQTAFEEIVDLHEQGYWSQQRDFGVQYEYFWDNTLPLYFMGSWTPGFEAIQEPSDLGVFPLPGTEAMVASVNWFTIPAYSENTEAAMAVLEGIVSPEGQRVWAQQGGFIASSTGVSEDDYDAAIMAQLTEMAAAVTLVPDLDDALGNPFQQEFWSQLKGLWSGSEQEIGSILERLNEVQNEALEADE